ncbi:MAG: acyl-CoA thioesterase [Elusimicrobia bacterium]|nr:acyl-CoA thioesterase [Elusimicrobiota bacterium]
MEALSELAEFRLTAALPVRFRDTDAMGHVNNAVYLTYLEQARVEYLKRVLGVTKPGEYGVILARVEVDYRSPVQLDDELVIGVRVVRLGGASFEMAYRIAERRSGRLVADAKSVQVCYDYKVNKVRKMPAEFAAKMREFDGLA